MPMDPLDPYVQLVMGAPPSPDYIPGLEAPPSPDYIPGPETPPSPDYIPGPEYPEYLPPADDMLLVKEQPLHAAVSPTAESPGHIRPTLTIADKHRADDKLIGRLRRDRRYFRTLATTYAQEDAHSRDYCTRIM
nr:hypothetical protein [Tanacetum cinerariifolium]